MRKLLILLAAIVSPALAQTPAGVINAPIYATGYISQVGGTNVTTNIPSSCSANGGFVAQFDLRSNIWRSLGSGYTANFRPFTGVTSQRPCAL